MVQKVARSDPFSKVLAFGLKYVSVPNFIEMYDKLELVG